MPQLSDRILAALDDAVARKSALGSDKCVDIRREAVRRLCPSLETACRGETLHAQVKVLVGKTFEMPWAARSPLDFIQFE